MPALRAPMQLRDPEAFRRLMRSKNLNDRALAHAAGLHKTTILRLRHQQHPTHLDNATAIADALGVTVSEWFRPAEQS